MNYGNILRESKRGKGRKKVKRDRAAAYRTIQKLSKSLDEERKKSEKFRKKLYRQRKQQETILTDSPRSRVKSMVNASKGKI